MGRNPNSIFFSSFSPNFGANGAGISDYEQGIVICGSFTRLHLFKALNHHEIVQNITHAASVYMNIDIKVVPSQTTLESFEQQKFGIYSA